MTQEKPAVFYNRIIDKGRLKKLMSWAYTKYGSAHCATMADEQIILNKLRTAYRDAGKGMQHCLVGLNLAKRHTSYNEKQLRAIYGVSKRINIRKHRDFKLGLFNQIRRALVNPIKYGTLYVAPYLPEAWLRQEPLVRKEQIEHITNLYHEDWEKLKAYAAANNPV